MTEKNEAQQAHGEAECPLCGGAGTVGPDRDPCNCLQSPEERFSEWFARNYPGPDTIIHDPWWHAPKIFRAAIATQPTAAVAQAEAVRRAWEGGQTLQRALSSAGEPAAAVAQGLTDATRENTIHEALDRLLHSDDLMDGISAVRAMLASAGQPAAPLHAALMELYRQVKAANEETDLNPIFVAEVDAITLALNGDLFTPPAEFGQPAAQRLYTQEDLERYGRLVADVREARLKEPAAQGVALTDAEYMEIYDAAHRHTFFPFQREARAILAQAAPNVPKGMALVPLIPNREMERMFAEGDWQWEDVLAAAEAITPEEYEAIATAISRATEDDAAPSASAPQDGAMINALHDLSESVAHTILTIDRQLDLIAERAPGDFLDKRPVVQSLGAHGKRLRDALSAAQSRMSAAIAAARLSDAAAPAVPHTEMKADEARDWAWQQVKQDVGTEGWTAADSGNFHAFYLWGWNYRGQYESQRNATPEPKP